VLTGGIVKIVPGKPSGPAPSPPVKPSGPALPPPEKPSGPAPPATQMKPVSSPETQKFTILEPHITSPFSKERFGKHVSPYTGPSKYETNMLLKHLSPEGKAMSASNIIKHKAELNKIVKTMSDYGGGKTPENKARIASILSTKNSNLAKRVSQSLLKNINNTQKANRNAFTNAQLALSQLASIKGKNGNNTLRFVVHGLEHGEGTYV
jgi:hypothetical protein